MNFSDFEWQMEDRLRDLISSMEPVKATELNLDSRSGYMLYVCPDCIAIDHREDSRLQYYGGFEYIDSACRRQYGDWVFYTNEDDRVKNCLECYYDKE